MYIANFNILYSNLTKLDYKNTFLETVLGVIEEPPERHCTCNAENCLYPFQNQQIPQNDS